MQGKPPGRFPPGHVRLLLAVTLAGVFLDCACAATAQIPCPVVPDLAQTSVVGNSVAALRCQAAGLLTAGNAPDAALMYELALLQMPHDATSLLGYAKALHAVGDVAAARGILQQMVVDPATELGRERAELVKAWALPVPMVPDLGSHSEAGRAGWQLRGSAEVNLGYDNNLSGATSLDKLTLTVSDAVVTLPLDPSSKAHGGRTSMADVSLQAVRRFSAGVDMALQADLAQRATPDLDGVDYRQTALSGVLAFPALATGTLQLSGGLSDLNFGGQSLYRAARVGAGRDWSGQYCRPRLGLELELRSFPVTATLGGRYGGLQTALTCAVPMGQLGAALRTGYDTPRYADRAGGTQQRSEARLWLDHPLAGGSMLQLELSLTHQRDAAGYSPLLEHGAPRRITRYGLHTVYRYPLDGAWQLSGTLDVSTQHSNLELFRIPGGTLLVGLRRSW